MKKRWISIVAVMVFAVLVAGAAYAYVDHNGWCTGNTGRSDMMGSSMGNMMGSPTGPMMGSSTGNMMSSSQGHMTGPSMGHMTARNDGKDQSYNCPGRDTGNQDTGNNK